MDCLGSESSYRVPTACSAPVGAPTVCRPSTNSYCVSGLSGDSYYVYVGGGTWHKLPLCVESYQDTGLVLGEEPAVWKQGTSGNMGSTWERWARGSLQGSLGEVRGDGPKIHGITCLLPSPLLPLGGSAGDSSCESRGGVKASSCRYWHGAWGMIYPLQPVYLSAL